MTSEEFVEKALDTFGFHVEKIEEATEKRPDFSVTFNDESYIVEVKEKEDTPEHIELAKRISKNEIADISIDLVETGTIRSIISKAKKQIDTFAEDEEVFRVVWFVCKGMHHNAQEDIIFHSLYSSVPMWDLDNKIWEKTTPMCYFFGLHSKFYRYRNELDAVIIGNMEEGKLCLNPYSPRYEAIKKSHLFNSMSPAIIDPIEEEQRGTAIIVDNHIDRSNVGEVYKHLYEKYGVNFKAFPLKYYSGFMKV